MTTTRANCFDFLRLFAAVGVVVSHSTVHLNGPVGWVIPGSVWSNAWFYDGVPMFFIISGYLVFRSGVRCQERGQSMWSYALNRFLRIVPALVVWAVAVGVLYAATSYYARNGSLWTIPAECSFYVAVPVVLWLLSRFSWEGVLPLLTAVALFGVGIGVAFDLTGSRLLQLTLFTFVPWSWFFLIGMLWWRYGDRVPLRAGWALMALVAYVLLRTVDVFSLQANIGDRTLEYVGALPLAYLVFFIGLRGPAVLAAIPRRIGDLSYGAYIWHMFVIDVILHFGWGWPAWSVLPATLVLAAVSWWLVEGPALRLKRYSSRPMQLPTDAVVVSSSAESP